MNILPKKKWHVRTKENMARVRRDEAKAAEEEQNKLDRALLAERERRLNALRSKADQRVEDLYGFSGRSVDKDVSIQAETGHVNLFQDLEQEDRKNLGTGNKEYDEEKRKEQQEWESKMGIQKALGEGTNELDKKKEWYEAMPFRKSVDVKTAESKAAFPIPIRNEEKEKKKHKKKHRKRSTSSSSESNEERRKKRKKEKKEKKRKREKDEERERQEYEEEKKKKLTALRDERLRRERLEAARTQQLLNPSKSKPAQPQQKYNSQFNPELCRQ